MKLKKYYFEGCQKIKNRFPGMQEYTSNYNSVGNYCINQALVGESQSHS